MSPRFSLVAIVATLIFAGCAEEDAVPPATGLSELAEEGAAVLSGSVIDTELSPIAGAIVGIGAESKATTDEAGRFEFAVEPGSHVLNVQALGFQSVAKKVDAVAGAVTPIQVTLERLPSVAPYIELVQATGYSSCDYMLLLVTGRIPEPCNTGAPAENEFVIPVLESWRFMVTEVVWQSGFANAETMRLFNSDDGDCASGSPCYGLAYGKQYARLEGEPGKTELVTHYDPWADGRGPPYPNETFELHVNAQWIGLLVEEVNTGQQCGQLTAPVTGASYKPGCPGVGVSTGIAFELWQSNFHFEGPEDRGACCPATKYSALPDR